MAIKFRAVSDIKEATRQLQASRLRESPTLGVIWKARSKPTLEE